jgi:hypothetical protein
MNLAKRAMLTVSVYLKVGTISVPSPKYFQLRMRKLLAGLDLEKA